MVLLKRVSEALSVFGVDKPQVVAVNVLPRVVVAVAGITFVMVLLESVEGRVQVVRVMVDVLPHRVHYVHVVGGAWEG